MVHAHKYPTDLSSVTRKIVCYLDFFYSAFYHVWKVILLIISLTSSFSVNMTCLVLFFSWLHSKFYHRRYCIAAFLTVPWLGLCFRSADIWTADWALLCLIFFFLCLCFVVLIVLVSPNLVVLPPEVLRVCLPLPLKVVWRNSYQCIFVPCCWLWHASSEALNCGKNAQLPQLIQL